MKAKPQVKYHTPKHTYVQHLTAIAKRAHVWAFVAPLSAVVKAVSVHQHVTHHHAVRF